MGRIRPLEEINFSFLGICDGQNEIIKYQYKKIQQYRVDDSLSITCSIFRDCDCKQQFKATYCIEALINSNDNCRAYVAILGNNYPAYVGNLVWAKRGGGKKT